MFDDPMPIGEDQACIHCKQPFGIHDGLCLSCVGRFTEGAPPRAEATQPNAAREAAMEAEQRLQDDMWHREQERREFEIRD